MQLKTTRQTSSSAGRLHRHMYMHMHHSMMPGPGLYWLKRY